VTVRLTNKVTGEVKDQEIYMGDFPMMTESGPLSSTARKE
jgi:DNA-directed RNA polymerase subunit beta